jgi:two-component system response regulator ChvI
LSRSSGFVVRSFADAASVLDGLDIATGADIIVLDRGLPDVSGIDLLAQLRQSGMSLPVVFLLATLLAPGNASRSIEAPSTSSARPVAWRFWSRVRRLLERPNRRPLLGQSHDLLVLNPNMSRAYWNDSDMGLTKGEYKIVHLLVSNVGRYVTYRAIYDRLHYEGFIAGSGVHGLIRPWIA